MENNDIDVVVPIKKSTTKRNIIYIITKIAIISLLIYVLFFHVFGIQVVNNESMKPSLKEGSLTFYYRLDKKYLKGDVVSAKVNGKNNIYRIIALENDKVDINGDGVLLINDRPSDLNTYYKTLKDEDSKITFPYIVKKGEVFLMNDYRTSLGDSRTYGSIKKENINGKVFIKLQIRDF